MKNNPLIRSNTHWLLLLIFEICTLFMIFTISHLTGWVTGYLLIASGIGIVILCIAWSSWIQSKHSQEIIELQQVIRNGDTLLDLFLKNAVEGQQCSFCKSQNKKLRNFPFDPRLHQGNCPVPIAYAKIYGISDEDLASIEDLNVWHPEDYQDESPSYPVDPFKMPPPN